MPDAGRSAVRAAEFGAIAASGPAAVWEGRNRPSLSAVVPTLDAGRTLEATLNALAIGCEEFRPFEIIVSDSGSRDETLSISSARGARVVTGEPGRGAQLRAGCATATCQWLLIVHADTQLASCWPQAVRRHIDREPEAAGWFRFELDDPSAIARIWERGVALRCAALALPYGDQGLLISRDLYCAVGGFRPIALMEDVDLARRIGRRRLRPLGAAATTSGERFRRGGYLGQSIHNWSLLVRYLFGSSPDDLARRYG